MDCPRCGHTDVSAPTCPRCGVVFAKLSAARPRPPLPSPAPPEPSAGSSGRIWLVAGALLFAGLGALAVGSLRGTPVPRASATATSPPPAMVELPSRPPPAAPTTPPEVQLAEKALPDESVRAAKALVDRLNQLAPLSSADLQAAEDLYARYPEEKGIQDLLGAVLLRIGVDEQGRHRFPEAVAHLRRSAALLPQNASPRLALTRALSASEDWTGAEAAAREVLALDPRNTEALESLAFALFRQDRNREAAQTLKDSLEIQRTAFAQSLLERIEKNLADESGMTEQHIAHFNVRYDGDAHEDVGREILRVLERHYSTLTSTLDHQPGATIPVILFSRQAYYDASGAPAWSGGVYDGLDGRIRIPIGGLTASLTPDMDETLIHEVTHAFIADRARGLCPRDVNEGFAQYMEGKRVAEELSPEHLTALADGRIGGVAGFYLAALSFVEYLMAIRGQGGMNDLLRVMGGAGSADEAFRQVYGQDHRATRQAWINRLRQQHGS